MPDRFTQKQDNTYVRRPEIVERQKIHIPTYAELASKQARPQLIQDDRTPWKKGEKQRQVNEDTRNEALVKSQHMWNLNSMDGISKGVNKDNAQFSYNNNAVPATVISSAFLAAPSLGTIGLGRTAAGIAGGYGASYAANEMISNSDPDKAKYVLAAGMLPFGIKMPKVKAKIRQTKRFLTDSYSPFNINRTSLASDPKFRKAIEARAENTFKEEIFYRPELETKLNTYKQKVNSNVATVLNTEEGYLPKLVTDKFYPKDTHNQRYIMFGDMPDINKEKYNQINTIFRENPTYASFIKETKLNPLESSTLDAFYQRQSLQSRGVVIPKKEKPKQRGRAIAYKEQPDLINESFTSVDYNKTTGGDRLNVRGGKYTSNSHGLSDRFSNTLSTETTPHTGYIGTLKQEFPVNKNLSPREQLQQFSSNFYDVDTNILGLDNKLLKNLGYKVKEGKYARRNGSTLETINERAYIPETQNLELVSTIVKPNPSVGTGRWAIDGVPEYPGDKNLFLPYRQGEGFANYVKQARAMNKKIHQTKKDNFSKDLENEVWSKYHNPQTKYNVINKRYQNNLLIRDRVGIIGATAGTIGLAGAFGHALVNSRWYKSLWGGPTQEKQTEEK